MPADAWRFRSIVGSATLTMKKSVIGRKIPTRTTRRPSGLSVACGVGDDEVGGEVGAPGGASATSGGERPGAVSGASERIAMEPGCREIEPGTRSPVILVSRPTGYQGMILSCWKEIGEIGTGGDHHQPTP